MKIPARLFLRQVGMNQGQELDHHSENLVAGHNVLTAPQVAMK